jgi:hypothetical protein
MQAKACRTCRAFSSRAAKGRPQGRSDRDLRHAPPPGADRPHLPAETAACARRQRARAARAAAGARGFPPQDRPQPRAAGGAGRRLLRRGREARPRHRLGPRRSHPAIVRAFPWPKSMRWGDASASTESLRWVRPLQGIVALFARRSSRSRSRASDRAPPPSATASTIPASSPSAAPTIMPRSCAPATSSSIPPSAAASSRRGGSGRRRRGADAVRTMALRDENAGLTEWPVPLLGRFDPLSWRSRAR